MFQGTLTKMRSQLENPVQYYLVFENDFLALHQLLNQQISITFKGFQCLACGENKKIFRQGYCYEDFYKQPITADWVMRPELSKAHENIEDRDLGFEKKAQLQPHIVYLAYSGGLKVGVTRKSQVPTRWIDQGAILALPMVETPNRYLAGISEVALKKHISDKTNWRKMLVGQTEDTPSTKVLVEAKRDLRKFLPAPCDKYFVERDQITEITYPYANPPEKVKSLSLDKTATFSGVLQGIKGQYLIFEDQTVFNIRNHEGYVVKIAVQPKK